VLEPDEGKLSSPVLRGLGASNGARPLGKMLGPVRGSVIPLKCRSRTISQKAVWTVRSVSSTSKFSLS
jgi:hypothetical protein